MMRSWSFLLFACRLANSDGFLPSQRKTTVAATHSNAAVQLHCTSGKHQDWDVKRYQREHSFVWEYGASLVDIAQPVAGERILDVGCGSGELTHALSLKAGSETVMGMDADRNMVQQAQTQYPELQFFQGDVRNFTLEEDNRVDLLFSNAALHWVRDAEAAVRCMAEAMKPGGRLVVELGGKRNVDTIVRTCQNVLRETKLIDQQSPWYFPSLSEYASLLERYGIEVNLAELYDRPTILEDGEDGMSNWILMFGSHFLEELDSEEETQIFLQQVSDRLRPALYDGTQWIADYRRLRVLGRKL